MGIDYRGLVTDGLSKQIAEKIRDAILHGRLQVHERLPTEEDLAARFDVSRATIREALKRLAAQNLIRSRRGPAGGTFVNKPSREELHAATANAATLLVSLGEFELRDIVEAREEIETVCCRLAVRRRTDAHLAALAEEIERQIDPALEDTEFCASDVRFHRTLVQAAGNPALDFAAASVIESLQPVVNQVVFRYRDRAQVTTLHARIHRAIAARDARAACAALATYMNALRRQHREAARARAARAAANED